MTAQAPRIGQIWPGQGGIYAGQLRNPETDEIRHIILHPDAIKAPWGTYGKRIEGADDFYNGQANTQAMRDSGHCAEIIAALDELEQIDSHSDFYLPAQRELNILSCNLTDHCEKNWHWSSTQNDAYYAWSQDFSDGHQYIDYKVSKLAARAVRSILVIE